MCVDYTMLFLVMTSQISYNTGRMTTKRNNEYRFEAKQFEQPSVTVDLVIFALEGKSLKILLIQRGIPPYKGMWALPGGFVKVNETLSQAAKRECTEETGVKLHGAYLEQLFTFDDPRRDPRKRVITIAHLALLPNVTQEIKASTDAAAVEWHAVDRLPALAFDHRSIIDYAVRRLQYKLEYSNAAYGLLPAEFTLTELQTVYETVMQRSFDKRNFRKKMLSVGLLKSVPRKKLEGAHRPAQLYTFRSRKLQTTTILQPRENATSSA